MQVTRSCKRCGSSMAILDIFMEGYDLICPECGIREVINRTLAEAPPCFQ